MNKRIGLALAMLVCCHAHALQVTLYGGISRTAVDLGTLHISNEEADSLHTKNENEGTIGAGLSWQLDCNQKNGFWLISSLLIGLNYFHFDTEPEGVVWLYGLPQFANYQYQLSLKTDRLLLNGQVELFPFWKTIHPYVEAGIGASAIRSQYWEQPMVEAGVFDGNLIFSSRTNHQFVYSLGAGIKKQLSPNWVVSFSYNFTDFGTIHAGPYDNDLVIQQPLPIDLRLHTALFGIGYQWM
ncbi:outer membrane protein [Legionella jamestowniensis]|uniref:Outer membrane protein beta-barrel domain-containing protein n=1 Tax=Legionella jamestowniensis TaxID=455 RepID=A0A0W0UTU6_9GAMM|nr:outer membrane beta-barrel protein [Legionella jamestowniensis]KTD11294.1 hypothetical protein Ljam_0488 [Legionella jamestowniensis]OCH98147.1 hypothetical protein A8135_13395 [Legionella jamestowniensis]SFL69465.1 Opacity protein [Legionella jamestowniensis DSM 19215]